MATPSNKRLEARKASFLAFNYVPVESEGDNPAQALETAARQWIEGQESMKWPRALQWFENASYLQGNHLTRFFYSAERGFGLRIGGQPLQGADAGSSLIPKQVDNCLLRPTETVVGMVTQTRPTPRTVANSTLPEDEDAADLGNLVVGASWESLGIQAKIAEAVLLSAIGGTSAIEIEFTSVGTPIEVPTLTTKMVANPFAGEEGEPDEVEIEVEGPSEVTELEDVQARVWSAFHLQPDPAATSEENMSWICRSSYEDAEWVLQNYTGSRDEGFLFSDEDDLQDKLRPETASRFPLYWWTRFADILETPQTYQYGFGLTSQSLQSQGAPGPHQVLFRVVDVRPTRQFVQGRTLIFAGTTLLWEGPARSWSEKYPRRWHPYAFFHWFKVPGKFWAVPLLTELLPLQKRINHIDALVHINRKYISLGQWLIPKHCKMKDGTMSGIPGESFSFTDVIGMRAPEKVANVPLPAELLQERADCKRSIDEIAASGLISEAGAGGIAPSAARAGAILDFLRQEKLRGKAPMLQSYERALEVIGQNILLEYQLHLDSDQPEITERIQKFAREYSGTAVESFTGADLREHHSVKFDIVSDLMHSPEAAAASALEFLQYSGGNVSPAERQGIMRATRLDRFVKNPEDSSVKRARRMISRIVAGVTDAAFPMPGIDVASVMAPVFKDEILSDRYTDHPPEVQSLILELFDLYAQMAQAEQQQAMQMQMMMAQAGAKPPASGKPA